MSSCLAQSFLNYKLSSLLKKKKISYIPYLSEEHKKTESEQALNTAPTSPGAAGPGGVLPIKFGQNNYQIPWLQGGMVSSEDSCKHYVQGLRYLGPVLELSAC